MTNKEYERQIRILQGELVAMQEWIKATGAKICVVFEGLDSAGKGGTIQRITERTSPRVFHHIALAMLAILIAEGAFLPSLLGTSQLTGEQWLMGATPALVLFVGWEAGKVIARRRSAPRPGTGVTAAG